MNKMILFVTLIVGLFLIMGCATEPVESEESEDLASAEADLMENLDEDLKEELKEEITDNNEDTALAGKGHSKGMDSGSAALRIKVANKQIVRLNGKLAELNGLWRSFSHDPCVSSFVPTTLSNSTSQAEESECQGASSVICISSAGSYNASCGNAVCKQVTEETALCFK